MQTAPPAAEGLRLRFAVEMNQERKAVRGCSEITFERYGGCISLCKAKEGVDACIGDRLQRSQKGMQTYIDD